MGTPIDQPLTNKQRIFVDEYLVDFNGTRAAIKAGYSQRSADVIACENLGKPNIDAIITAKLSESAKRNEVTRDSLTNELWKALDIAREQKQASAMTSVIMAIAKLHGLYNPRSTAVHQNETSVTHHIKFVDVNEND